MRNMARLASFRSAVHLAVVVALSAIHPSSAVNATAECPQPERQICPGTPFAVLRDPANNCTFYDCPPAPPGYIDWTAESSSSNNNKNNDIIPTDLIDVDEQPTPPPNCTICTNIPTANMMPRGLNCTTAIQALATRCADSAGWVAGTICQSSCYFAGRGYDGDVCCPGDTAYPTMSPTKSPSVSPSEVPTVGLSWVPTAVPTAIPSANGTAAPTISANSSNDINGTADDEGENEIVCDSPFGPKKVGELYFTSNGCNYCVCGDGGVPACTALVCPVTPTSSASSPPTASPTMSPTDVVCPNDVLECEGNITLTRDPAAGCEFGPAATCPPTTLPPGTSYKCAESSSGIYPVDLCLGFIWCQDGEYLAGPSLCPSGMRFDSSCQCCKDADEVNCEVGFGRNRYLVQEGDGSGMEQEGRKYLRR